MARPKRQQTTDAVEILRRRFVEDDTESEALLEEMRAERFELIAADARQNARPGAIEIARNGRLIERAHRQLGGLRVHDERDAAERDAEGGGQTMRLARERGKRSPGLVEIARLVEDPALERERLIGAQAIGVRPRRADGKRLGSRQFKRKVFERTAAREMRVLQRTLVDFGGDDFGVKSDS